MGTIEVLPDGRARIRTVIHGKRRQIGPIFPDVATAERFLAAWNEKVRAGSIVAPTAATLGAFGSEVIDLREIEGSAARAEVRDVDNERSIWRRHVVPSPLADRPLDAIRVADVEAFVMWLRRRPKVAAVRTKAGTVHRDTGATISTQTQKHALRLVRLVMGEARRREIIPANPAELVRIARAVETSDGWDWLRQPEIDRLLACAKVPARDRAAYAVGIFAGLRLNEIKRVHVADVHLDAEVPGPHVVVRFGRGGGATKSGKVRRVPVLPALVPILRAHLATLPQSAALVFGRDDGEAFSDDFDFGWAEKLDRVRDERTAGALEVAGVERRVRFHDLRHTCGTHLAAGTWGRRWAATEIKAFLGHSDLRVTERYIHIAGEALATAARETPGPSRLPTVAHGDPAKYSRTQQDSNLRPSAPEQEAPAKNDAHLEPVWATHGQPVAHDTAQAHTAARAVLAAVASGTVAREQLEALAAAVLGDERVRLALDVREGGPLAVRRAVELAALVLEGAQPAQVARSRAE